MAEPGEVVEFEEVSSDVEDTEDGGAIIKMGEDPGEEVNREFYENIVENFPESDLDTLATRLMEDIDRDKKSRERRDKDYEEAIKRTGLGKEAPGGADFEGASKAVHPLLTEACVDFAARAIRELMPANGPVKTYVPGERPEKDRLEKAERKKDYMNWQFLVQMPEFRSELEQLLTQLPLGGSQYLRLVWDSHKKRPVPIFVPVDNLYLPYAASNFYTAERRTYVEPITRFEFDQRVKSGMYRDIGPSITSQLPDPSKSQEATNRVEGREANSTVYNEDGLKNMLEVSTHVDLEGEESPYLITIDEPSRKIVSIIRNWEEEDETREDMFWMVEFPFVPWRGAYSIGLGQMIGSLSAAATGALRALLDSAHINNIPTLLKLKGANLTGQSKELNIGEITEIEGGIAGDMDIRKLLMAVPFNPPSPTLFQLLGFVVDAGRGVVRTTFEKLADQNPNMPVGTTLALIEEGMKVMSGIHARLYHAMGYIFKILHRIDRLYLEDEEVKDDIGEVLAHRRDFELPLDVVPVANPEIFSDVQRMAQLQVVADRAANAPDIYDRRMVEKRILEHTKIPNPDELLLPLEEPEEQNPVNENATMTLGRPVAAFPEQDHLAHIQVHLDYMRSPVLGGLLTIAPAFIPACLEHIKEHITLWYVNQMFEMLKKETGRGDQGITQMLSFHDPETRNELERTLASFSQVVIPVAEKQVFTQIPGIIQEAMQMIQSLQQPPQMPIDPNKTADIEAKKEIEGQKIAQKQQSDQSKEALERDKLAQAKELEFAKLSAAEQAAALDAARKEAQQAQEYAARLEELLTKERAETERTSAEIESREKMNAEDNETALTIAAAEITSGERVAVETGTGINPDPSD